MQSDRDAACELTGKSVPLMDYLWPMSYDEHMKRLSDHHALFEGALRKHSQWPPNDHSVIFVKTPLHHQVVKTDWSTTVIMWDLDSDYGSEMVESEDEDEVTDEYGMVEFEIPSDTTDLDKMSVDTHSPTLLCMDLRS